MDRKVLVAALAVLGLGLSACGSSGSSEPMSRAEFARKANAICVARNAGFAAAAKEAHGSMRRAIRAAVPAMERYVHDLGDLRPPTQLRWVFAEILAHESEQLAAGEQAASGSEIAGGEDGPPLHRHERMRVRLGMGACNS